MVGTNLPSRESPSDHHVALLPMDGVDHSCHNPPPHCHMMEGHTSSCSILTWFMPQNSSYETILWALLITYSILWHESSQHRTRTVCPSIMWQCGCGWFVPPSKSKQRHFSERLDLQRGSFVGREGSRKTDPIFQVVGSSHRLSRHQ